MAKTNALRADHQKWLTELTCIPTAAGREHRVIRWIEAWVRARRNLVLKHDKVGNLVISRRNAKRKGPVVFLTAHLDHPAFVVSDPGDGRTLQLEFRGGVHHSYFVDTPITVFDQDDRPHHGRITAHAKTDLFDAVEARLTRTSTSIEAGDLGVWKLPGAKVRGRVLHAPACDDLAAVAAALAAMDVMRSKPAAVGDVRILLTRAEEIGFLGAIVASKSTLIPKGSKVIALENSRSYADSPLGSGPIIRVGDKMSVFHHGLLYEVEQIAQKMKEDDPSFQFQRKLMPGGTCEATAFQAYGHESICLCLPLGNYHNQGHIDHLGRPSAKPRPRIDREYIHLDDYRHLIDMLVHCARSLSSNPRSQSSGAAAIHTRLEGILEKKAFVLTEPGSRV